jgi:hypothetical protein
MLICILSLAGIFHSCNKSNEISNPCLPYTKPDLRIKEIATIEDNKTYISEYLYDGLIRLAHRTDSGESYFNVFIWKYEADKVYVLNQDSTVIQFFNLDPNGYAINTSLGHYTWEYDSSGYLLKQTESWPQSGTMISNYFYNCWNNVTVSDSGSNLQGSPIGGITTSNEYYSDLLNTTGNENMGIAYYGKQNNCLLKISLTNDQTTIDTLGVYSYEFDSQKRVTREIKKKSGNIIRIRTFKYFGP